MVSVAVDMEPFVPPPPPLPESSPESQTPAPPASEPPQLKPGKTAVVVTPHVIPVDALWQVEGYRPVNIISDPKLPDSVQDQLYAGNLFRVESELWIEGVQFLKLMKGSNSPGSTERWVKKTPAMKQLPNRVANFSDAKKSGKKMLQRYFDKDRCFREGEITFAETMRTAKYLIVPPSYQEDPASIIEAMTQHWGMQTPRLTIGVSGPWGRWRAAYDYWTEPGGRCSPQGAASLGPGGHWVGSGFGEKASSQEKCKYVLINGDGEKTRGIRVCANCKGDRSFCNDLELKWGAVVEGTLQHKKSCRQEFTYSWQAHQNHGIAAELRHLQKRASDAGYKDCSSKVWAAAKGGTGNQPREVNVFRSFLNKDDFPLTVVLECSGDVLVLQDEENAAHRPSIPLMHPSGHTLLVSTEDDDLGGRRYLAKMSDFLYGICQSSIECQAWLLSNGGSLFSNEHSGSLLQHGMYKMQNVNPRRSKQVTFMGIVGPDTSDVSLPEDCDDDEKSSWEDSSVTIAFGAAEPLSQLQLQWTNKDDTPMLMVTEVPKSSDAFKQGLRVGAIVVEVKSEDGKSVNLLDSALEWQSTCNNLMSVIQQHVGQNKQACDAADQAADANAPLQFETLELVFERSPFVLVRPDLMDLWEHSVPLGAPVTNRVWYSSCKDLMWKYHSTPWHDMLPEHANQHGTGEMDRYMKRVLNPYISHFIFFPGRAAQHFHAEILSVLPHMTVLAGSTFEGVRQACYAIESGAQVMVLGRTGSTMDHVTEKLKLVGHTVGRPWQDSIAHKGWQLRLQEMSEEKNRGTDASSKKARNSNSLQLAEWNSGRAGKQARKAADNKDRFNLGKVFPALTDLIGNRPETGQCSAPSRIEQLIRALDEGAVERFMVFDALSGSSNDMTERMTRSLSISVTPEMSEIGYHRDETKCLEYAWELHLLYQWNAERHDRCAEWLHWLTNTFALITTACALVYSFRFPYDSAQGSFSIDVGKVSELQFWLLLVTSTLPLISSFFLSVHTFLNPRTRAAFLYLAAFRVKQEIYRYRCRVGVYNSKGTRELKELFDSQVGSVHRALPSPAALATDVQIPVLALPAPSEAASAPASARATESVCSQSKTEHAQQMVSGSEKKQSAGVGPHNSNKAQIDTVKPKPKNVRRVRETFADELRMIQEDLMRSDVHSSAIKKPPDSCNFSKMRDRDLFSPKKLMKFVNEQQPSCLRRFLGWNPPAASSLEEWVDMQRDSGHSDFNLLSAVVRDSELNCDDGIKMMIGDDYFKGRLLMQLHFLNERIPKYMSYLRFCNISLAFLTAACALLALLNMTFWVPLCVACASSVRAIMDFYRLSDQLLECNQALAQLRSLRIWWQSLSHVSSRLWFNENQLVELTEAAIAITATWVKSLDRVRDLSDAQSNGRSTDQQDK